MSQTNRNLIDGEWRPSESGEAFAVEDPAHPSEVVARYQKSTESDAKAAIEAATRAADEWAATPGPERGKTLRDAAMRLDDRAARVTKRLVREEGKTRPEAAGEVARAVDILHYYAEKARDVGGKVRASSASDATLYTTRTPVGVAGLVTPWNYPIAIPAWKLAPALATGNATVLKPASQAPGVALELVEVLNEAGLPDGVVNLVTGPGSAVGQTLAGHDAVDAVSFTGSTDVGTRVYDEATNAGARVQTEMGGKNPTVIAPSADVAEAADIVADGAFGVTGQACTATSRAIVHETVHDEFVDALVDRAERLEVGPGLDGADMGPQVSESELESTLEYIRVGRSEGAVLRTGGGRAESAGPGYFVEPTVFTDVDPASRIGQEEIFGPVVAVHSYTDFERAMEIANGVRYGLSASIVTDNHTEAEQFVRDIEAGVVKVNEKTTGVELHAPFGGFKRSSSETFREQGDAAIDFYTISKTVYENF